MNRQQRRNQAKSTPAYRRNMTREEKLKAFYKNGITVEDLERNHHIGFEEGWRASADNCLKTCYAAVALVMSRQHQYSRDDCAALIQAIDEAISMSVSTEETLRQVIDEIGLEIDFGEAFSQDRVKARK